MTVIPTSLLEFVKRNPHATLAEIVEQLDAARKDLRAFLRNHPHLDPQEEFRGLYQDYFDHYFDSRADYRAWRVTTYQWERRKQVQRPSLIRAIPPSWDDHNDPIGDLLAAVTAENPIDPWGTLAVTAKFLKHQVKDQTVPPPDDRLTQLAGACKDLLSHLSPLPEAPIACAIVQILTLSALEHERFDRERKPLSHWNHLTSLIDKLDNCIRQIDATWRPGRSISTASIQQQRWIIPFRKTILDDTLQSVFYQLRQIVFEYCCSSPSLSIRQVNYLSCRAYEYMRSAWLQARSNRIAHEDDAKHLLDRSVQPKGRLSPGGIAEARRQDIGALQRLVHAARDAGRYLEVGILGHYLMCQLPDDLYESDVWKEFRDLPRKMSHAVRQLGFEIPKRFRVRRRRPTPFREVHRNRQRDPFQLRLLHDMHNDACWHAVLKHCPRDHVENLQERCLGYIQDEACKGRINDPEALHGAFQLCVKYGEIDTASRLLQNAYDRHHGHEAYERTLAWEFTKDDLLKFAGAAATCARACPVAICIDTHQRWRRLIKRCWSVLPQSSLSKDDVLFLHQASLGFCSTTVRASAMKDHLAQTYYNDINPKDFLSFPELRV